MGEELKAARVNAAVARAMIRAMAMQADNAKALHVGMQVQYGEHHFIALIQDEAIDWNSIVEATRG
jgi:hypothetical protein